MDYRIGISFFKDKFTKLTAIFIDYRNALIQTCFREITKHMFSLTTF